MPGSHPKAISNGDEDSSYSDAHLSQFLQHNTQSLQGASTPGFASSQHGTTPIPSYRASSVFGDLSALPRYSPPTVLEPRLSESNMTLADPFRPATSHVRDRSQHLLSTFQGTLPGKDNGSAATAYSSNSVPVVTPTDHRDQSARISHNQVGLRDSISDEQAMVSNEVQIVEISYLSLAVLRQYLYAIKDPSKLPGPNELDRQLQHPGTRKNLVKNMKLLVFHNFVRERNGLEPTTAGICRTCLAERGVFCVPHGQIPGQGCFCPRKKTRGKKHSLVPNVKPSLELSYWVWGSDLSEMLENVHTCWKTIRTIFLFEITTALLCPVQV
ncbi:hypothetical protein FFLO_04168 [Filobasidium floriforme]|uniref:Uncharacterized protein n=1 Tax=Filobasidium floriforme TaxID=5210 RepID=A0A8K0NQ50_9TREE|nr:uncharacterized protein HD553DRAFT_323533 [Filobasidium floriforme]KAG7531726.1 hypothetical protein FFLO_04168 [Filobasidium floriforme]KAH8085672.1 hypothetical protein HD553DRAFT_323533 [Filobasidium floriforme]